MKPKCCQILIRFVVVVFFFIHNSFRNTTTILRSLFFNYLSSAPFDCSIFSYLINAIQLSIDSDKCNSASGNLFFFFRLCVSFFFFFLSFSTIVV